VSCIGRGEQTLITYLHSGSLCSLRVQNRRKDLVHSAALQLDRDALIRYDRKSGSFQATDLGRIASQYYVTHTTLREFNEHLKPTMGEIELLKIFCLADEFKYMVRTVSLLGWLVGLLLGPNLLEGVSIVAAWQHRSAANASVPTFTRAGASILSCASLRLMHFVADSQAADQP
jgi:hypothetical protein